MLTATAALHAPLTVYQNEIEKRQFVRDWWQSLEDCKAYGAAILADIDAFLDKWQSWSDANFGELQQGLLLIGSWLYATALYLSIATAKHCGRAARYWHEQALSERIAREVMTGSVATARHAVRIAKTVFSYSRTAYAITAPVVKREGGRMLKGISSLIGFILCINW